MLIKVFTLTLTLLRIFLGSAVPFQQIGLCAKIDPCTLVDLQDITLLQDPSAGLHHDETPCKNLNFQV